MDWKECCTKKIVKTVKPDENMAASLLKSSDNKIASSDKLEMSEVTAASKISLAYDSLRELLEAIALRKGHKIYNHECYKAFLKEMIGRSITGDEFDEIRKIRNSVNYYGKDISTDEASKVISRIKALRTTMSQLI